MHVMMFLLFDTFFFGNKVWFNLNGQTKAQNYCIWSSEKPQIFWTMLLQPPPPKRVRWDLEGPINPGYLAHCSYQFFISIRIEFLVRPTLCYLSLVTPTLLARLFINPEFCQCPPWGAHANYSYFDTCSRLRTRLHQLVIGPVTVHLM